jgi:flagellar biogenesis protein FliO
MSAADYTHPPARVSITLFATLRVSFFRVCVMNRPQFNVELLRKHPKGLQLIVLGLIVIVGGIAAPQLLPEMPQAPRAAEAAAEEGPGSLIYTPPTQPAPVDPRWLLVRLVIVTALVLGLAVGSLWLGKRWLVAGAAKAAGPKHMQVIETLPLANRCSVVLIEVGKRQVLVGLDATGLQSMVPLPERFDLELATAALEPADQGADLKPRHEVYSARVGLDRLTAGAQS